MLNVASGVSGASPIWNKIITKALKDYPQHWPTQPAGITGTLICSLSGLKAPENPDPSSCPVRFEYFINGTVPPVQSESSRRDIPIFRPAQTPATSKQVQDFPNEIEYQNHTILFDQFGTMLCLDCAGGFGLADIVRLDDKGKSTH